MYKEAMYTGNKSLLIRKTAIIFPYFDGLGYSDFKECRDTAGLTEQTDRHS
jgi:hypothetical protein